MIQTRKKLIIIFSQEKAEKFIILFLKLIKSLKILKPDLVKRKQKTSGAACATVNVICTIAITIGALAVTIVSLWISGIFGSMNKSSLEKLGSSKGNVKILISYLMYKLHIISQFFWLHKKMLQPPSIAKRVGVSTLINKAV